MKIDETTIMEVTRYLRVARFPWEKELKRRRKEHQDTFLQLRQFFANRSLLMISSRVFFISYLREFLSRLRRYLIQLKLKKLESEIIHLKQKVNYFSGAELELKKGKPALARGILIDLASRFVCALQIQVVHMPDFVGSMPSRDFHILQELQMKLKNAA